MLRIGSVSEMTPEEFWAILHAPVETKPIFFRLYHNEDGDPICYSMEDMPGNYIELTAEQYHLGRSDVRVINGQLIAVSPSSYIKKLTPSKEGITCDPRDICIVVAEDQPNIKWSLITNESN